MLLGTLGSPKGTREAPRAAGTRWRIQERRSCQDLPGSPRELQESLSSCSVPRADPRAEIVCRDRCRCDAGVHVRALERCPIARGIRLAPRSNPSARNCVPRISRMRRASPPLRARAQLSRARKLLGAARRLPCEHRVPRPPPMRRARSSPARANAAQSREGSAWRGASTPVREIAFRDVRRCDAPAPPRRARHARAIWTVAHRLRNISIAKRKLVYRETSARPERAPSRAARRHLFRGARPPREKRVPRPPPVRRASTPSRARAPPSRTRIL